MLHDVFGEPRAKSVARCPGYAETAPFGKVTEAAGAGTGASVAGGEDAELETVAAGGKEALSGAGVFPEQLSPITKRPKNNRAEAAVARGRPLAPAHMARLKADLDIGRPEGRAPDKCELRVRVSRRLETESFRAEARPLS